MFIYTENRDGTIIINVTIHFQNHDKITMGATLVLFKKIDRYLIDYISVQKTETTTKSSPFCINDFSYRIHMYVCTKVVSLHKKYNR